MIKIKKMKVAIQGIKGSFHHIVAEQYFGKNIDLVECLSFSEMPGLLHDKKAEVVIMAIENSIAGAILTNYALIDDYKLTICGEHHMPIHHTSRPLHQRQSPAQCCCDSASPRYDLLYRNAGHSRISP